MGFHFMDLVVILVIGLLIFGPKKLQEISRGAGKTMRQVNAMKEKMLSELPMDELAEVRQQIQIPTIPTSPQQAFKMIASEEKPERKASQASRETPEAPQEAEQSEKS